MQLERQGLIQQLFEPGMPRLMCPPLTHFSGPLAVDRPRMSAHYAWLAQYAGLFLVPDSTGDGWLMDDAMMLRMAALCAQHAREAGGGVLVAVLKPSLPEMLAGIKAVQAMVREQTGRDDLQGFLSGGYKGITVCAPRGEGMPQAEIAQALRRVLDLGLPTALYQLPQMTLNEISPQVVADLVRDYPHFYLFKDTSGRDAVALSGVDTRDLYLVRGAEGQYARWFKPAGGPYDGFLLSTANGFARQLAQLIQLCEKKELAAARQLSNQLDALVSALFALVSPIPVSNAFANSARIADHVQAHGPDWQRAPAPMLPDGSRMDEAILQQGCQLIQAAGFVPQQGYLSQ